MSLATWFPFFLACWVISVSPGAGAIASMASGLRLGFRRGYWTAIGLQFGLLLQIAVVAAGVGALLATSSVAFTVIKWFGVLYLIYLAVRQWRAPVMNVEGEAQQAVPDRISSLVVRGFLINAANPKATVFMLAVLPQFIQPHAPLIPQYAVIMVTMVIVDLIVMAGYTGLASRVLRLMRSARQQRAMNRTFAGLFGVAAALLASVRRVGA
ncbi:LysE family transporter [Pseudomonas sp. Marseille-QA0892]